MVVHRSGKTGVASSTAIRPPIRDAVNKKVRDIMSGENATAETTPNATIGENGTDTPPVSSPTFSLPLTNTTFSTLTSPPDTAEATSSLSPSEDNDHGRGGSFTTTVTLPMTKVVTVETITTTLTWKTTTALILTLPSNFSPVALKEDDHTVPILGGLLGLISLILVAGVVVLCFRRRKDNRFSQAPGYPGYGQGSYLVIPTSGTHISEQGAIPLMKDMAQPAYAYPSFYNKPQQDFDASSSLYEEPFDPYSDSQHPQLHRFPSDMSRSLRTHPSDAGDLALETRSVSTISSAPVPFHEKIKAARRAGHLGRTSEEELEEEPVKADDAD